MASVVLDVGALIAIDRGDRRIGAALHVAGREHVDVITSSACVAQVASDRSPEGRLARALAGIVEHPLDAPAARRIGRLLAESATADVAQAAAALLAGPADVVLTGSPKEIRRLIGLAGTDARVEGI
ncbi:MAG: hypothetical protein ACR2KV_06750 [Solirubrobacteraceae bacterium]